VLGVPLSIRDILETIKASPGAGIVDLLQTLLPVVAVVLGFTPAARPWFRPEPPLPSEVRPHVGVQA